MTSRHGAFSLRLAPHRTSIAIRVAGSSNTVTLRKALQHLWIREGDPSVASIASDQQIANPFDESRSLLAIDLASQFNHFTEFDLLLMTAQGSRKQIQMM